jgi:hypothetical protein
VESVARQTNHHIASTDAVGTQQSVFLYDSDDETCQIIVLPCIETRHLRRLAAYQRASILSASSSYTRDDRLGDGRVQTAKRYVVEEEERERTLDQYVVHTVIDQIGTYGIVPAGLDGDPYFGPYPIGARDQERSLGAWGHMKESAKTSESSSGTTRERRLDELAHPPLGVIGGIDVDA